MKTIFESEKRSFASRLPTFIHLGFLFVLRLMETLNIDLFFDKYLKNFSRRIMKIET